MSRVRFILVRPPRFLSHLVGVSDQNSCSRVSLVHGMDSLNLRHRSHSQWIVEARSNLDRIAVRTERRFDDSFQFLSGYITIVIQRSSNGNTDPCKRNEYNLHTFRKYIVECTYQEVTFFSGADRKYDKRGENVRFLQMQRQKCAWRID